MSFEELEREVKQDLAAERWKRYLPGIIALAVSVLIGVGGYKGYQYYQQQQNLKAAELYYSAKRLLQQNREAGLKELDNVIQNPGSLGYQPLAQFALAAEYLESGESGPARLILLDLADNTATPEEFAILATLQAAMIPGDAQINASLTERLKPYLVETHTWRHIARIAAAELALANQEPDKAREYLTTALEDTDTPVEVRQRINKILTLL